MNRPNDDVRRAAAGHGVPLWKVAEALGIADSSLSRKLRKELPAEERLELMEIIDHIATMEVV